MVERPTSKHTSLILLLSIAIICEKCCLYVYCWTFDSAFLRHHHQRRTNNAPSTCFFLSEQHQRSVPLTVLLLAADRRKQRGRKRQQSEEFLDVEFERVVDEKNGKTNPVYSSTSSTNDMDASFSKSWLEWSLEADPAFNSTRIPFYSSRSISQGEDDGSSSSPPFIDVRLAFLVDLDGATYGIGVPFDNAVALTLERDEKETKRKKTKDSSNNVAANVEYLPPTQENEELMEIMAAQLHQHVGNNDLYLQRTPRVLTVRGPLVQYIQHWKKDLFPKPFTVDELLDETDEDLEEFHRFMRAELGEDEYLKTLNESPDDDGSSSIPPEILELFSIPGLGDQEDDIQGMTDLMQSMLDEPPEVQEERLLSDFQPHLDHDGAALKLVSYIFPENGKSYSLVSLLKPYVLVAKCFGSGKDGDDESVRFELLSPREEQLVIPQLEKVCKADLDKAGLQLLKM